MAPHPSTLAWKTPWAEEPGRLQSMGSLRVGHDWTTSLSFFTFMHWRRKWQPTPVFLPGEFYGQRSPAGYSSWSRKESDTTEQLTLSLSSDCFPFSPRCTARLNFASSFTLQYSYLVNSCQRNVDGITSHYWDVYVIWALHNWGIWGNLGNLIGHSHSHFLLCVDFHTETAFSSNSGWKPSFKKTRHYQWYQHHTGVRCSSFYPLFLIAK